MLPIPDSAWQAGDDHQRDKMRGDPNVDPLDGHKLLCRLKVAAGLMWLNGRTDKINEADWDLAGIVIAVSDETRAGIRKMLDTKAGETNKQRGRAEGVRAVEAEEIKRQANVRRVAENIVRQIERDGGEMARTKVRNKIAQRDREYFDDAEEFLILSGRVEKIETEHNNQPGHILRVTEC